MDFWTRLELARTRWNVLEHSFYQRWSGGTLTREELGVYAGQYGHAVRALAQASASAARAAEPELRAELERHAKEEADHVRLWDGFTTAAGGDVAAAPTAETEGCARAWAGADERSLLEGLVTMYAIESGQPRLP